ncbi:MAG TPA: hypothetical protein ACN46W_08995, partial [Prochlorococcus sp.]
LRRTIKGGNWITYFSSHNSRVDQRPPISSIAWVFENRLIAKLKSLFIPKLAQPMPDCIKPVRAMGMGVTV